MAKTFNVTGLCIPEKHYMVDLGERVREIRKMVDRGDYFCINRARQYGKTTTLAALAKALDKEYLVISLDFQTLGSASFQDENTFSLAFLTIFLREMKRQQAAKIPGLSELAIEMQKTVRERDEWFDLLALFEAMAGLLYDYTSGYPYLVSRLCKLIDEKVCAAEIPGDKKSVWTKDCFLESVRMLLSENNTLFESLIGKLAEYPELDRMLAELLFLGKTISYNPTNQVINLALMFGFVKNEEGKVVPANRIFDTLLYNHFLSSDEMHASDITRKNGLAFMK